MAHRPVVRGLIAWIALGVLSVACEEGAEAPPDGSPPPDAPPPSPADAPPTGACVVAADCDDRTFCNGAEWCDAAGNCQPGTPPPLDDGVDCTVDGCDEARDLLTHTVQDGACDDGDACTGDVCQLGVGCTHPFVCACASDGECDDGNPCTDDDCLAAGACDYASNSAPCEDGLYCDGADTCALGACTAHAGDPCAEGPECGNVCDEAADSCLAPSGLACMDDGVACTVDACDGEGSCTHEGPCCGDGDFDPGESCGEPGLACANGATCDACACQVTVALSATGMSTCAWLSEGRPKCWGDNALGQLGLGDHANRGDGPGEMGDLLPLLDLGTGRTVRRVVTGYHHACARLDDDTLKCWGYNGWGQLGLGDLDNRGDGGGEMGNALPRTNLGAGRTVRAIAGGGTHTCAILDNDALKCWGANDTGQLGLGHRFNRGDGLNEMGDLLPAIDLGSGRRATEVVAGAQHTCAILDDGSVRCWGSGLSGTLGLGNPIDRGDGPGEMGDALPAVALGTGRTAVALAAGSYHTCALLDDASVKCWGENSRGQLGLGDRADRGDGPGEMGDSLPAVALGSGRVLAIGAGGDDSCARFDDGRVKCWGNNIGGELGLGDTQHRGDDPGEMGEALPAIALGAGRSAVAIAVGADHACAILDDAQVKCWGSSLTGALGQGGTDSLGDAAGEMGDALPAVALGL